MKSKAQQIVEQLLQETPTYKTLEKYKEQLSPEERAMLKGKSGASVWKATVDGQTYYYVHTHRAGVVKSSMRGVLAVYDEVEATG